MLRTLRFIRYHEGRPYYDWGWLVVTIYVGWFGFLIGLAYWVNVR
jgi:hypothetical protein